MNVIFLDVRIKNKRRKRYSEGSQKINKSLTEQNMLYLSDKKTSHFLIT